MIDIEVMTPDGWQKVGKFVKKPKMIVKDYYFENYRTKHMVSASDNHKFQLACGDWVNAKDANLKQIFISDDGDITLEKIENEREEEVCDIEILHENHRYYTNGISSHNTGGNALRYYLSARYVSSFKKTLKEQIEDDITGEVTEERTSNVFKLINIKNKINDPYKRVDFVIKFGEGIDDYPMIYDVLNKRGIITNNGSFMIYKTSDGEEVKVLGKTKFNKELREKWFSDMKKQYMDSSSFEVEENDDEDVKIDSIEL